jgi:Na+/H+ antiporter NhaC
MSWLSLLPPLLAIVIALWRREVLLALLSAILLAELILAGGHPLQAFLHAIERIAAVTTCCMCARNCPMPSPQELPRWCCLR